MDKNDVRAGITQAKFNEDNKQHIFCRNFNCIHWFGFFYKVMVGFWNCIFCINNIAAF